MISRVVGERALRGILVVRQTAWAKTGKFPVADFDLPLSHEETVINAQKTSHTILDFENYESLWR